MLLGGVEHEPETIAVAETEHGRSLMETEQVETDAEAMDHEHEKIAVAETEHWQSLMEAEAMETDDEVMMRTEIELTKLRAEDEEEDMRMQEIDKKHKERKLLIEKLERTRQDRSEASGESAPVNIDVAETEHEPFETEADVMEREPEEIAVAERSVDGEKVIDAADDDNEMVRRRGGEEKKSAYLDSTLKPSPEGTDEIETDAGPTENEPERDGDNAQVNDAADGDNDMVRRVGEEAEAAYLHNPLKPSLMKAEAEITASGGVHLRVEETDDEQSQ